MSTSERLQTILEAFRKEQLPDIESHAESGEAEAQLTLGVLYANGRGVKASPGTAVEWLEKAAAQDVPEAMTLLGWMYANGHGVASSVKKARDHYAKAAERGDSDAQCSLADLLLAGSGKGTPAVGEAMHWYQSAANAGHPKAQFMLGKLMAEGTWVDEDLESAFQWLTLAVMSGSEPARREMQMLTARLDRGQIETFKQRMMERMQTTH